MVREANTVYPIMEVDGGRMLSTMGDLTVAFSVELPELFSLSDLEYESLHQSWVRAIRTLPSGSIVHKQDWFLRGKYRADFAKAEGFLSRSSERHFSERPYLEHSCYLMLSRPNPDRSRPSSLVSGLLRGSLVPRELQQDRWYDEFMEISEQFARILRDSGLIGIERMSSESLLSTGREMGLLERYLNLQNGGELPLLRDIDFSKGIRVGDLHCQLFSLCDAADMPSLCGSRIDFEKYSTDRTRFSVGFASPLGMMLPFDHIYNQYVFVCDPKRTQQELERKRLRLQSLSVYSRSNLLTRDATNDFLNESLSQHRTPVRAHFNVLAWTDSPQSLPNLRSSLSSAIAQMDATGKQETVGAPQVFWAGIPGNASDFPMNDTFLTFAEQASCMLNHESSSRSTIGPVGIRLGDRMSGKPLHVDISDEPMESGVCTNRNKFVLGPSGSGKSFFTNHLVRTYHHQGSHLVLVDVGHSYKGLCDLLGGYYFTYTEDEPVQFNPFHIGMGDSLDTEKKESIKTLLLALWKKDDEPFRRSEYVALSNAITGYYRYLDSQGDVFACFDTFYDYLGTHYLAVLRKERVKLEDFDVDNFLYVLRPFYSGGEFGHLLNSRNNLDLLGQRMIVFELDSIKDHPILFPVVTIIIMEVFISKMRKMRGLRKVILIEEAWKALMKEGFASYIQYLFKTVRKFFGEAIVVTQDIEDIIASPVVKQAIINNSDCKILLDQRKYQNKFDQVQQLLGLTDKEKSMVLSLNRSNDPKVRYKEVFISLGGRVSRIYRTEVSLEEYLVRP